MTLNADHHHVHSLALIGHEFVVESSKTRPARFCHFYLSSTVQVKQLSDATQEKERLVTFDYKRNRSLAVVVNLEKSPGIPCRSSHRATCIASTIIFSPTNASRTISPNTRTESEVLSVLQSEGAKGDDVLLENIGCGCRIPSKLFIARSYRLG